MLMIRLTPSDSSSDTCEGKVSSGPRKRKLGRIIETMNSSRSVSVAEVVLNVEVVGVGRAVDGVGGIGGDEFITDVKVALKLKLNALAGGV
jgi:hypothetical protein